MGENVGTYFFPVEWACVIEYIECSIVYNFAQASQIWWRYCVYNAYFPKISNWKLIATLNNQVFNVNSCLSKALKESRVRPANSTYKITIFWLRRKRQKIQTSDLHTEIQSHNDTWTRYVQIICLNFCIRSLTSDLVLSMVEPNKKLSSNQQQRHLIKFWDNESKTDSQCFNNTLYTNCKYSFLSLLRKTDVSVYMEGITF